MNAGWVDGAELYLCARVRCVCLSKLSISSYTAWQSIVISICVVCQSIRFACLYWNVLLSGYTIWYISFSCICISPYQMRTLIIQMHIWRFPWHFITNKWHHPNSEPKLHLNATFSLIVFFPQEHVFLYLQNSTAQATSSPIFSLIVVTLEILLQHHSESVSEGGRGEGALNSPSTVVGSAGNTSRP